MSSLAKERKFKIRAKDFEVRDARKNARVRWRRFRGVVLRDVTRCVTVVSLLLARARVFG